jgi:ABC-type glycerol-3-phosphate transport system permease component
MRKNPIKQASLAVTGYAIFFILNFPIIALVLNSLKPRDEIYASEKLLPQAPTLMNFVTLFERSNFAFFLRNSFIVVSIATILSIVVAALSGYAISRWRKGILEIYSRSLLVLQMFPIILVLIPIFILFRIFGLIDALAGVILIYTTLHLPFAVWMFRGFFDTIPLELEDAGIIDGCTRMQVFTKIILPLSGPGILSVAIFSYLFAWNEFLIASVFLRSETMLTVPVGVQVFIARSQSDWGSLLAAAVTAMLPTLVLFTFLQKYFVSGALAGGVKG